MTKRDKNLIIKCTLVGSGLLCLAGGLSFLGFTVIGCILGACNGIVNRPPQK